MRTFHGVAPDPNFRIRTFSRSAAYRQRAAPTSSNDGPDPVFLLKQRVRSAPAADRARRFPDPRQHVVFAGPSIADRHAGGAEASRRVSDRWPFETELRHDEAAQEAGPDERFDDLVFEGGFDQPLTRRQKAVRTMAMVTYAMIFLFAATILTDPDARREVLSWMSFGHAAELLNAFR
jgi:hypothetical protein